MKRALLLLLGTAVLLALTPACEMHPASETSQEHAAPSHEEK